MNNAKDKFLAIVFIVLLIAFSVIILAGFALQLEVLGNYIEGLFALIAALIAVVGVSETIKSNQNLKNRELLKNQELKNQELLNSLDQKSEWRKELMIIAAKPIIELEDIFRILASLRFLPKSKVEIEGEESKQQEEQSKNQENREDDSNQKEFDVISNFIYKKLNTILNDMLLDLNINEIYTQKFSNIPLSIKDSEEIRLYTKFLLKHHWEYNKGEKDKKKFKKKELNEFKKVMDEIHRLNQEDNIKKGYYKTDKIYTGILDDYAKKLAKNNKGK
ncbi:hypothetical protein [Staphylococcus hominis]|uniref:hypothetical protein n=1 Tax=Staphylococcus hominis TaxID=1290 RepID=UPI0010F93F50|nr:hypothetical protein [Staphylococcus hominis]